MDLLEKYDQKLDEMQESLEIKEVEKLELEEKLEPLAEQASDLPLKASRDTLNKKIVFLQDMVAKLQDMRNERSMCQSFRSSKQMTIGAVS